MRHFFIPLFWALFITSTFAQNGKNIEKTKIAASADSILNKTNPFYPEFQKMVESVDVYRITYLSDGLKIKGYMDVPKKPGKYPCIIYNRGGNRETGKLKIANYMANMLEMASWGYCVIGSQYRGNDGGEGMDEFGGKDVDDVLNMIPLLNYVDRADTSRIGMWVISRGGLMIYLVLTKLKMIKAAVVVSGLAQTTENTMFDWIPEYRTNRASFLKERTAHCSCG